MPTALEKAQEKLIKEQTKVDERRLKRIKAHVDYLMAEIDADKFYKDANQAIADECRAGIQSTSIRLTEFWK